MKSDTENNYYVYVYIDPRNHQEFYCGKGKSERKYQHTKEVGDSEKHIVLDSIKKEKLDPIIKVIAAGLSESEALLIEKTLIWKLGHTLTNKSSGHYADKFRPQNTLHRDLFGFDYKNEIWCLNVGEGEHRSWEDSFNYGFISAGQDWEKWGSRISEIRKDDIVCAYISGAGYVGVGKVIEEALPAHRFKFKDKPLSFYPLVQKNIFNLKDDEKDGEFIIKVEWLSTRDRKDKVAGSKKHWRSWSMLGSFENQTETLKYLEQEFKVDFTALLKSEEKESA